MLHSIATPPHRRPSVWIAALIASSVLAGPTTAQSASIGADIVSRYVWRGLDFGESMSVQPALTVGIGGLELGAWGSYSINPQAADFNENDLWVSYTHEFPSGASVSVGMTDYYFPAPGSDGFTEGDAHTQEFSASVSGPESFPVSLYGGLLTDDDSSLYIEAAVALGTVEGVELGAHAGMVGGKSDFYAAEEAGIVSLGVTASKALQVTDSFAPPVTVSYILNPAGSHDRAFLVFALSLAP